MNQEYNNESQNNRFIFNTDFYDKLDDVTEQNNEIEMVMPQLNIDENQPVEVVTDSQLEVEIKDELPNVPVIEDQPVDVPVMIQENVEPIEEVVDEVIESDFNDHGSSDENVTLENSTQTTEDIPLSVSFGKNMEKEMMKINAESHAKPTIVGTNGLFGEATEVVPYRANRTNKPTTIEEPKITDDPIHSNPQVEEIKRIFNKPNVINIDKLLEEEISTIELMVEEKKIEKLETNDNVIVIKSELLDELREKERESGKISILSRYGEDFCNKDYITNPAIGRDEEIKELILILLTPEKSGILVGKPGIGKTAIVEGLAYRLQRNNVPDALKGYRIVSVKTTSLIGTLPNGETRLQALIDELKDLDRIILFIDEVHMLMGATTDSSLDFANMFKESLGRGSIKMIGATTNDEYERYVLRDKAFVRRFQRVDVLEPSREHTIEILMGSLPKIEKQTGVKLKYSDYIKSEIMGFIVDITTEYKRIYGIGSRYPDICLTLVSQAFSQAVFDNRKEVDVLDIRNAIANSKNIYPDVIRKELVNFDTKFKKLITEE